jgi:hypothetical protein
VARTLGATAIGDLSPNSDSGDNVSGMSVVTRPGGSSLNTQSQGFAVVLATRLFKWEVV